MAQLSGHKNIQSLSSYKSASISQQRNMSDTLSRTPSDDAIRPYHHSFSSWPTTSSQTAQISGVLGSGVESVKGQTLFAGVTIGSINNCIFNVVPFPAQDEELRAKRPREDSSQILND